MTKDNAYSRRWPVPADYLRWQKRTMTISEQMVFLDCLVSLALLRCRRAFPQLSNADHEDLVHQAAFKHAETFREGHLGTGRQHLVTILLHDGTELLRKLKRKPEVFLEDVAQTQGFDSVPDYLDSKPKPVPNLIAFAELQQLVARFEQILDTLPPSPWSSTFRLYVDWEFSPNGDTVTDFIEHVRDTGQLFASRSAIHKHIREGLEYFATLL